MHTKREGDLWADVINIENIRKAYRRARQGKTSHRDIIEADKDPERCIRDVQRMLMDGSFHSSEYTASTIVERGKTREIVNLPFFPDRIVHWAVMQVVSPILMGSLIEQTFAAIPGRGTHQVLGYLNRYLKDPKAQYCLKTDVSKYFRNIDTTILKTKLRKKIKDRQVLSLLDRIIDEYPGPGIPLGNRTSQDFANFYLSEIDHTMKEKHHCHYYLRYMDDIVIIGYSKPWLHRMQKILDGELNAIGLQMKSNWQVFPIKARGIDFVGYRTWPEFRLLRKSTKVRLKRAAREIKAVIETNGRLDVHDLGRLAAYNGVLRWCDSYRLYHATLHEINVMVERQRAADRLAKRKVVRHETDEQVVRDADGSAVSADNRDSSMSRSVGCGN